MADINSIKDKILSGLDKAITKTIGFAGKAADATRDAAAKTAGKTRDVAEKAAGKAKAGARIAKLNIEIAGEKENMKKTYLEMGKLYYDTHKDSPEGFFIQLCEEIALAEQNIAEKEAEIEALKAEDDGSIEVEFEEIVDEEEPAAEEKCECSCKEKLEDAIETVEDMVEEVIDTVEDKVEEIVED